jgi:hypothetical protein
MEMFINTEPKEDYDLDNMPKSKLVAGVDTLLPLLTHHWARDVSIFRTEDDRLDYATIDLFLAYTGCRSAELVNASKGTVSQNPLGEDEDNCEASDDIVDEDPFDDDKKLSEVSDVENDSSESDDEGYAELSDTQRDGHSNPDSGDNNNGAGASVQPARWTTNDTIELDGMSEEVPRMVNVEALEKLEEIRKWKAICYEDVSLWIVPNPKPGGRDLLAMEVFLRYHKGVENKPKPYASDPLAYTTVQLCLLSTISLFRENTLPILCPITHVLSRAIRDDAVLVDGYTSADPFFATNLGRIDGR